LISLILSLLLLPTVTAQYEYKEWPIMYENLRGFGIKYDVAMQVLGVNPEADIRNIAQGLSPAKHDFRVWIWQSSEYSWTFKNVDVHNSWYFVYDVCKDPLVEGVFFEFADGRRHLLYAQSPYIADDPSRGLVMHMLKVETWEEKLYVRGCKEDSYDEGKVP